MRNTDVVAWEGRCRMGGGHAGNGFGSEPADRPGALTICVFPTRMGRQGMQVSNFRQMTAALAVAAVATVVSAAAAAPAQAAPPADAGATRDAAVTSAAPSGPRGGGLPTQPARPERAAQPKR